MGEEYHKELFVEKGSDMHKYISVDVLHSQRLPISTWVKKGETCWEDDFTD
jgi:hypothetical protein